MYRPVPSVEAFAVVVVQDLEVGVGSRDDVAVHEGAGVLRGTLTAAVVDEDLHAPASAARVAEEPRRAACAVVGHGVVTDDGVVADLVHDSGPAVIPDRVALVENVTAGLVAPDAWA